MTKEALNFAIAAVLEPQPQYCSVESKVWRYSYITRMWQPRDFINDPSLSFLLLKRLAEEGDEPMLDYEAGWMVCGKANDWTSTPGYRNFSCARYPEPGPAIAEYYARVKGIYIDDKA